MEDILFILSMGLISLGYVLYLVVYLVYGNKKAKKTGYDAAFEVLKDDDTTKIVRGSNLVMSNYNGRRTAIRLSNRTYNGADSYSVAEGALLAGISLTSKKSSAFSMIEKVFKNFRIVSASGVMALLVNLLVRGKADALLGIILFMVILVYQYLFFQVINSAVALVRQRISDKDVLGVYNFIIYGQFLMISGVIVGMARAFLLMIG